MAGLPPDATGSARSQGVRSSSSTGRLQTPVDSARNPVGLSTSASTGRLQEPLSATRPDWWASRNEKLNGNRTWGGLQEPTGTDRLATQALKPRWISAAGTGGYHFLSCDDHLDRLHEASEAKKLEQRAKLKEDLKQNTHVTRHDHMRPRDLSTREGKLSSYDINGKVYCPGVKAIPFPEQSDRHHWLCQVNGMTNQYNIINNMPLHRRNLEMRNEELQYLRTTRKANNPSGDVQPQRDVASYDIPGFVPLYARQYMGTAERLHLLSS
eukprot:gnl/TRDRNA2_/TRDRNA2_185067_c0_seq1.p1 gnl/TRDRNA2_/TRDRNA2_185067_c0~~gnl/TRDRNA2_/TRDRNA2_185067_c0_seq1.p1  ORF type:complete len:268 (-),score=37.34 gnl/TRDRNA2_/TRDRNA2_185067_c0_seq1:35-838(-)